MNEPLRVEHQYLRTGDITLHCAIQGDGPIMIFLHGFPEFWYGWKNQIPEFATRFKVIAPDMRGYNLSDKPAEVDQYKMRLLVKDIVGLIHALGQRKVILVGHDWGGIVAWALALSFPHLLNALVILNAPHPATFVRELNNSAQQQQASRYILLFRSEKGEEVLSRNNYEYLQKIIFSSCRDPAVFNEGDRVAYLEAWAQPGAITGGLNYYRASSLLGSSADGKSLVGREINLQGKKIQVPTLVIWGERDVALTLGLLRGLEEYVKQLSIKRIADATHWVQHDTPEVVNQYIWEFVNQVNV